MHRLAALLFITLAPLAAAQNEEAEPAYRWAEPVKEDANLYRIDDKLYRSEQLTRADAPHIKALGIKSVVNLRYFDRNDNHTALAQSGAELFNQPLLTWRITPKQIAQTCTSSNNAADTAPPSSTATTARTAPASSPPCTASSTKTGR